MKLTNFEKWILGIALSLLFFATSSNLARADSWADWVAEAPSTGGGAGDFCTDHTGRTDAVLRQAPGGLDIASTALAVGFSNGSITEANPLISGVIDHAGLSAGLSLALAKALWIEGYRRQPGLTWARYRAHIRVGAAVSGLAAGNNVCLWAGAGGPEALLVCGAGAGAMAWLIAREKTQKERYRIRCEGAGWLGSDRVLWVGTEG